ncbi:MAG TPA: nickel-dependent lactate racemase, partial [Candidatus Dormibacteraeota bacterium]|nr:nickel-dependent lactate racemase [Candidatus Dormibacteraeota bacterium]
MARVRLAYGRTGLEVDVPAGADVIEPRRQPALADEATAVRRALREPLGCRPLRELVPRGAAVGVSVCDVTRPFPAARLLPVLLEEIGPADVTVFVATGTHRACTREELERMLGREVLAAVRVVQHDAFDRGRHAELGSVPGTAVPALVERAFLEQDVRLTAGFIEPHFFAGFSGGPKMVAPGLAHLDTVLELHSAARIGHPRATWGVTGGNPVHDPIRAIAARAGVALNLDVTLDDRHRVTAVFAGSLEASHAAGCAFAKETAMAPVSAPYDVVVSTNSGYPLDQNLYQTVKGMSAAAQIVRPGGAIVMASECSDGVPEHGRYKDLLREAAGPAEFLDRLERQAAAEHDQWQVQVQALIQRRARVLVHAGGLTPDQV